MENKNLNITGVIASILLLIVFITASFAYFGMFTVNLENKVAVNIYANDIGNTSFIATSANLNVIVPKSGMFKGNNGLAAENTATLSVNLTGAPNVTTTCTYDVVYEYNLDSEIYGSTVAVTSGATKEITLEVESSSGTNNYASETNFAYDSSWTPKTSTVGAKKVLIKGATIKSSGESAIQDINITGRYYNLDLDQSQLGDKSFMGTIYVENNSCSVGEIPPKAYEIILANNGGVDAIEAKGMPDFLTQATTNDGMYATEDDYGTSYYFRGAVDNNWLKFGEVGGKPIYWRIIRINGDGSIRLIYTGTTAPTESQKVVMTGEGTQISTSAFNEEYDKAEYVGYKYEIGKQHGLTNDSVIKTTIDNWYKTTSLYNDIATSKLVIDSTFCYDRTASTSRTGTYGEIDSWVSAPLDNDYYYGSYGRIYGNKTGPSLKCSNDLDKFSVANGTLSYPVGLITADEINMAGCFTSTSDPYNMSFYLYTGQEGYKTGSPSSFSGRGSSVFSGGSVLGWGYVYNSSDDRPVISLSSEAKLSGNGTWNNPYVVES